VPVRWNTRLGDALTKEARRMATRELGEATAITRHAFMTTLRWTCVIVALTPPHVACAGETTIAAVLSDPTGFDGQQVVAPSSAALGSPRARAVARRPLDPSHKGDPE
jgi:hypothetical protein